MVSHEVTADRAACVGSGNCVLTAPDVFDQDEDAGLVSLHTNHPTSDDMDAVRTAVLLCPAGAISVAAVPADDPSDHPADTDR